MNVNQRSGTPDAGAAETTDSPPQPATPAAPAAPRIGAPAYLTTLGSTLFIQGCTVLQGVLIARLLGPEGRGQFAAATLWPTWFASIGLLGIDVALARRAGKGGDPAALSRTAVLLGAATSIMASLAVMLLIPVLLPAAERRLLPLAWAAVLLIPINHLSLLLQATELGAGRFGVLNLSRSVLYPVYLVSLSAMWLLQVRSVGWVIAALVGASACVLAVLVAARWRDLVAERTTERPGPIVREGLRFGLVSLGAILQQRADQIILLWLLPVEDLGVYLVALSAASVANSAAGAVSIVSFTRSAQADARAGFHLVARDFRGAAILSVGAAVVAIPALPYVLPLIYGKDFSRAGSVAVALVAGSVMSGLSQILDQALRAQGRPFSGLVGRACAIAVLCVAGLGLTTDWGILGMGLAYVASQATILVVLARSARRHFRDGRIGLLVPRPEDARTIINAGRRSLSRLLRTETGAIKG